jgi:Arc/MetJ-type ribon-helix-helix transcriptional regulator
MVGIKVERKELTTICVMIPQTMRDLIEQVLSRDTHTTLSEFVRDAIRRRLERMGYNPQLFEVEKDVLGV